MKKSLALVVLAVFSLLITSDCFAATKCTAQKTALNDAKLVRRTKNNELRIAQNQLRKVEKSIVRKTSTCQTRLANFEARADSKNAQLSNCNLTTNIVDAVFDDPSFSLASCTGTSFLGDILGDLLCGILGTCPSNAKACETKVRRICPQLVNLRTLHDGLENECNTTISSLNSQKVRQTANVVTAQAAADAAAADVEVKQAAYTLCMNGA